MADSTYDVLVLGGGINGRCALFHLLERGIDRVGLVERFDLDHSRGSSHSHSRVTRSAYVNEDYVRLMQVAHSQEWPRLEKALGRRLIYPNDGCFFGPPGGLFEKYASAVMATGVNCDVLDVQQSRNRFPMLRFANAVGAVHDRTAGVIAAAHTMQGLAQYARDRGADLLTETKVIDIRPEGSAIGLVTESQGVRTSLSCERLIIAAGPWAAALLPWLEPRLTVTRQTVGYFRLEGKPADFEVGRCPVWGNLGSEQDPIYYGLPTFGRDGIKIARHITHDADDDPECVDEITQESIDDLRRYLQAEFVPQVESFLGAEHCHYTNTATEDFIIDLHPEDDRIAIGAGFSGHGFKFGPVTGRALVELVCEGQVHTPELAAMRELFSVAPQ